MVVFAFYAFIALFKKVESCSGLPTSLASPVLHKAGFSLGRRLSRSSEWRKVTSGTVATSGAAHRQDHAQHTPVRNDFPKPVRTLNIATNYERQVLPAVQFNLNGTFDKCDSSEYGAARLHLPQRGPPALGACIPASASRSVPCH